MPSLPDLTTLKAVLFDLDGVLTPTAEVHQRAWADLFSAFLAEYAESIGTEQAAWTRQDYFDHLDGRPRLDGVRTVLKARGIDLPEGDASDGPDAQTVHGLAARKNSAFTTALERDGVQAYPGSVRLLEHLAAAGTPMAVVSSSANAPAVMATAGIDHFFAEVVDGAVAAAEKLAGKPAPDTFLHAAERLGATAATSAVLEDATSGVAAGAAGHFAHVIGVNRGAGRQALLDSGATIVVDDLEELLP
ncbi:haloacid dehalogenase [Kytococcus schroeteri]|uniref:Beta-phosphoglucomutase n=1 Tax=Kytococcus schroeteri TaxID=138300 RepID=A0A2I1PCI4_9MICO|nr:beta-phosphoglucomutase family hydrolase [Kytococcus schroeteri]PKZ42342.1 haloacid dehalogenase [Kytococcus schroeteri]